MASSSTGIIHKSVKEKYMGHKLALYSTVTGTSWVSLDGQIEGPYDTVEEAQARLERQKSLYKLAFYARSHREARRNP